MISLNATIRNSFGKKTRTLKNQGKIPAVVYGPGEKNVSLEVDEKEFKKVFKMAGESSLVELQIAASSDDEASLAPKMGRDKEKKPVLVHEIQKDPVSGKLIHIDFYQADLKEEVEVAIPLVFEGTAPAEKDLGGTLNKNMLELEVKALPMNLPHEIKVDISGLKTFEDHICVKDLALPKDVKVLKNPDEIVAQVLAPQKVEEELAAEITENVEDVEKIEKEKKEEVVIEPIDEK